MHHLRRSMAFLVLLGPWHFGGQGSALRAGERKPRLMPVPPSHKAPLVKLSRTATLLEHLSDALRLRKPEEALRLAKALPKGTRARNREGEPLLLVATQRGYLEVVAAMLDRGVPVDGPALFGTTALMVAAAWNHNDLVDLLLARGASLRARDANGDGAFCYAVAADNPATLERMRVQDPGCLTRESKLVGSLFRHAAEYSLPKSLAWLLDHLGVPTGDELRETLEEALAQEDLIILTTLLERRVPVESPTKTDSTLLLGAVRVDHLGHLELLLQRGAALQPEALELALAEEHLACAHALLKQGLKVDQVDAKGWTPLLNAAERGQANAVALLLAAGANARLTTPDGATAADLAEASPDKNTLALLRLAGVNLSGRNLRWEHDLDEALARAKPNRQQVFLCLWAGWSESAVAFKDEVLSNPEVKGALRTLVPLSIQVEDEGEHPQAGGTQVARRYQVRDYPTLLILDANGQVVRRHAGVLTPTGFLAFLEGRNLENPSVNRP